MNTEHLKMPVETYGILSRRVFNRERLHPAPDCKSPGQFETHLL